MKKKFTVVLAIVLIVSAISATVVFASDNGGKDEKSIISSMFDAMRNWSQQALAKGEITKDQANSLDQHFNSMEKYHEQNGLGACGGTNNATGNGTSNGPDNSDGNSDKQSYTPGYRGGMMGSFAANRL
jgi:hypothetical protein